MDKEELEYSIDVVDEAPNVKGFVEISSYIFYDEIVAQETEHPVGLPFCVRYVVGYKAVQNYMK